MNGSLRDLLSEVKTGLQALYGPRLEGVYLFGSYARGEQRSDSDVDVLVVLDRVDSYVAEIDRSSELIAGLSLEYNVLVGPVFVPESQWHQFESPFLDNAREDAIPI